MRSESKTLQLVASNGKRVAIDFPETTNKGVPDARSWRNVEALVEGHGIELRRNDFTGIDEANGRRVDDDVITDVLDKAHKANLRLTRDFLIERLKAMALENRYHPVRRYLRRAKWDGRERLDTWLCAYLGAPDTDYTSAVGRILLIAAVRRVRVPGTKFDTLIIFEGGQGSGKSTAIATLAVKPEWFTDSVSLKHDSKLILEQTEGKLIVEIPELSGMRKAEIEHVKANLSRTHDRARMAYARLTSDVPRQFIMIGTTNPGEDGKAEYLKDHTGNRRFLPVRTGKIRLTDLKRDVEQLWAEAAHYEAEGESIVLPRDLWEVAARQQKRRMEANPYLDVLRDMFGERMGKVLVEDVWQALGKKPAQRTQDDLTKVGRAMKELGWDRTRLRDDGDKSYFYVKGDTPYRMLSFFETSRKFRPS